MKDDTNDEKVCTEVLLSMLIRERETDEAYMEKYYDFHMAMLNRGGLTLVKGIFRVKKNCFIPSDLHLRWRQSTEIQKMHLLL